MVTRKKELLPLVLALVSLQLFFTLLFLQVVLGPAAICYGIVCILSPVFHSYIPEEEREQAFFLYQYSETNLQTSGKLFFGQWWADAIGAKNVAEELSTDNSVAVNMEQIYAWNPELIFITNFTSADADALYNNTVGTYNWSVVDAVENHRVYKMPLGMYRSYTPGVDTPVTLLWLAKTAYPHLFEDIDIIQETKTYYKEVFGIDLTQEQAASIFAPASDAGTGF